MAGSKKAQKRCVVGKWNKRADSSGSLLKTEVFINRKELKRAWWWFRGHTPEVGAEGSPSGWGRILDGAALQALPDKLLRLRIKCMTITVRFQP